VSPRSLIPAACAWLAGATLAVTACVGDNASLDAPTAVTVDARRSIDATPPVDALTATCTPTSGLDVALHLIDTAPDAVVLVTSPPGDARQFVVERGGTIQILRDDHLVAEPFLDLSSLVSSGGERGLLGLAFHPEYGVNGRFYVDYTTTHADGTFYDEVAEYRVMVNDRDRADPHSARVVLSIPDYAPTHNGGMIEFGSDGFLYISDGDGGGPNDPQRTAQDLERLLGKILRIDVDHPGGGRAYGIPADNPFARGGGAPEVFLYGLRNPWRWSFDRATGDLYIGDVGQICAEEIDVIPAASARGADLGWSDCEGTLDKWGTGCDAPTQANRRRPAYEQVRNSTGCGGTSLWRAVIGGQVYRGSCYPDLVGRYFFTDYGAAALYSFVYAGGQATDVIEHAGTFPKRMSSIHADALGELYVGHVDGQIYRIEAR